MVAALKDGDVHVPFDAVARAVCADFKVGRCPSEVSDSLSPATSLLIEVLLDSALTVVADPDVEISPSSSEDKSSVGSGHSSMVINDEACEL